jgi:hypothetical protein
MAIRTPVELCKCPVVQSGGAQKCISNAGHYSEQVNEPAVDMKMFLPTVCHLTPDPLWEITDLVESDDFVIMKKMNQL